MVDYGTGSGNASYSQLSYDASGSYFDFDMSILEPDFSYEISYLVNEGGNYSELKDRFNFVSSLFLIILSLVVVPSLIAS